MPQLILKPHMESNTKYETAGASYKIEYTFSKILNNKQQSNASKLLSTINKMAPNEDLAASIEKVVELGHKATIAKTNFEV